MLSDQVARVEDARVNQLVLEQGELVGEHGGFFPLGAQAVAQGLDDLLLVHEVFLVLPDLLAVLLDQGLLLVEELLETEHLVVLLVVTLAYTDVVSRQLVYLHYLQLYFLLQFPNHSFLLVGMVLVFQLLVVQLLLIALDGFLGLSVLVLHELHLHGLLPLHCL